MPAPYQSDPASLGNTLNYQGQVSGVNHFDDVRVLLTGEGVLETVTPDAQGYFKFSGLSGGEYAVKVRKPHHSAAPARQINLDVTAKSVQGHADDFELEVLGEGSYRYHWEEDQSTAGNEYSAAINQPLTVEFLDETLTVIDEGVANQLYYDFNIVLANDEIEWSQEHSYRLNEALKSISQKKRESYKVQPAAVSQWLVTDKRLADDIEVVDRNGQKTVRLSAAVFTNANPRIAKIEGRRGVYYSQRLHHALVRFVTNDGKDKGAVEKILNTRYGVSMAVPDYGKLTASTTDESAGRFQDFHPEERVQIINMFEEMPKGMHKLPELKYLVRRLDGTPHPRYSSAPAVAWSFLTNGYIEFMESAFKTSDVEHMQRLILHEKTHFLWQHQFDERLKSDWIAQGGWYQEANHADGWATTKQTQFISAYAHLKNPNEDMAESISYFIVNPDKLRSRAPGKYEFIRDRIMQGNIYISKVHDDLTFQVYNLYPDYVFPGKIRRLDIKVEGGREENKVVTVEIELHALDKVLEGATHALTRVFSEVDTFKDVYLYPVDADGNKLPSNTLSTTLRGSFKLSKYAKNGYWRTKQIVITDAVGNERFEGANDFGWKLYIDNPLEDLAAPEYVLGSAALSKSTEQREGQSVQIIEARWQVEEAVAMRADNACYASLKNERPAIYSLEKHGEFDDETNQCQVGFVMPHYMPSGNYSMNYLKMTDAALNARGVYFGRDGDSQDEPSPKVALETDDPDITQPELDPNDIQVSALPTHPQAPNGETAVTIKFKVRDDISGYRIASLHLRDPQGIDHHYWAYNDDGYRLFPQQDPRLWQGYDRTLVLPIGSAPGVWGVSQMTIYDRAGNFKGYDFTEIVHFDVIE